MGSRNSGHLRTVDVARLAGYSVQQIRNLEQAGVLPPAVRTDAGYRVYDESHVLSARAYGSLAAGAGPVEARKIMRAAHTLPGSGMLALLDAAHARLDQERRDLEFATTAARVIADEPIADVRRSDDMSISELANALGVRSSALRHWDAEGLVVPSRGGSRAARRYAPEDVRDARIVHQLRSAGYRITQLRELMPQLRGERRWEAVMAGLAARGASIEARSRALFEGGAALGAAIAATNSAGQQSVPE
ncbi:MerR family transcriptional regulator [Nocardia sp. NPDC088792]|uniref:MerR family transcriptional regulator n=1 Tax=Nocardia sp. NPDC088792 TaxID=3364332 RepID=UPI0037FBDF53